VLPDDMLPNAVLPADDLLPAELLQHQLQHLLHALLLLQEARPAGSVARSSLLLQLLLHPLLQ
jgi:hypothetical protein